ncbi:MAG: hypothetical protein H0V01_07845 [Bacteroidetes bacterium]|nr:hypothetical protein [Bacteroidota bacterium]HET6244391.1 hypothetical protein [Bacteroidia bacterium]
MKEIKILLVLSFLVFTAQLFAQDLTIGGKEKTQKNSTDSVVKNKVMIIPFEERMYFSEFDKEISEADNLSFQQIRDKFRNGVDTALYLNFLPICNVLSMLRKGSEYENDIDLIYAGIGYSYEVLPVDESSTQTKVQNRNSTKKIQSVNEKGKISKGQLLDNQDNQEKFMATTITNENLLNYLNKKYDVEYFVFVNQLDVKRKSGTTVYEIQDNEYIKEVRIHYTILDYQGKRLAAGISSSEVPSKDRSFYSYFQKGIKPGTSQIAKIFSLE